MIRPFLVCCILSAFLSYATSYPGSDTSAERTNELESGRKLNFGLAHPVLIAEKDILLANSKIEVEESPFEASDQQYGSIWRMFWGPEEVHNLTVGEKTIHDRKLYGSHITKDSKWMRVVTRDVMFETPGGERISYIEVYDTHPSLDSAGYASITSGWTDARCATIHLKSARGSTLQYYVSVYGRFF